jgi:hypothetical protein
MYAVVVFLILAPIIGLLLSILHLRLGLIVFAAGAAFWGFIALWFPGEIGAAWEANKPREQVNPKATLMAGDIVQIDLNYNTRRERAAQWCEASGVAANGDRNQRLSWQLCLRDGLERFRRDPRPKWETRTVERIEVADNGRYCLLSPGKSDPEGALYRIYCTHLSIKPR